MQFEFETLDYQLAAIEAVTRLFEGQPHQQQSFSLQAQGGSRFVGNDLLLDGESIAKNLNAVQQSHSLSQTGIGEHGLNFTVKMETGTGKTYVYLRTIYELNQQYGWTKFVIVVPSVPIREGVLHTLNSTRRHFAEVFDNPVMNYHEYSSSRLSKLRDFATNNHIEILVMNIQTFEKDANVINRINESGEAPIGQISQTRPIVIIDEPQNMETDNRRAAIESLNPLFTLRYSATHKQPYHKVYSLNPVQAYNLKLVKQIEVLSVLAENDVNGAFVELLEVQAAKGRLKAKLNIHSKDAKETKKKSITAKSGDDLYEKSGGNEAYRHGFIIDGLDFENQQLQLSDGRIISLDDNADAVRDEVMKTQIRRTIEEHLAKEKRLNPQGIKVLSLFFIDKVENYRHGGKFERWFDEIYRELTGHSAQGAHNGYFSQDKNGWKDTKGNTEADNETYALIMRDKEKLLDLSNPLRFIFSHSALKEGWDNPNVFQICTLNETRSPLKKRQEIGRGLRLPVNCNGKRVYDEKVNVLTVIPNESYQSFAATLQQEYRDECGITFAADNIKNAEKRKTLSYRKDFSLDPEFLAVWEKLRHKTRYRVQYDTAELIQTASKAVSQLPAIQKPKIRSQKARICQSVIYGIETKETADKSSETDIRWPLPDILNEIQQKTGLTRRTVFEIIRHSGRLNEIAHNPQRFIDLVAEKINAVLQQIMVEGIQYQRVQDDIYRQSLLDKLREMEQNGMEFYANDYTFSVQNPQKTIYADYIPLDSATEKQFAADCENYDASAAGSVPFYFKLPNWFKVPTPLGNYNPDWAVVVQGAEKIYFVAETKNTGKGIQSGIDESKLHQEEQLKIAYARKHFAAFEDLKYQVVQKLSELKYD